MTLRWLAVVLGCVACGDAVHREDLFTATSGSRLALQLYRFDDGTEQPEPGELYDTRLHTRCTPRRWIDDVVRCVPVADDAVYIDDACTDLVGLSVTMEEPTHFLAYQHGRPARAFAAGAATDPVSQFFVKQDDGCVGPFPSPQDPIAYFEVGGEIDGADLVPVREAEAGTGRIAVQVRVADDGMLVPFGLRDRELGVVCTPALHGDGSVACEPTGAAPASYFLDPTCDQPVVAVTDGAAIPAIARVVERSGCPGYRTVGGEVSPPLYRRVGDRVDDDCIPAATPPGHRLFAATTRLELPALERTLESIPGRRLQRIILDDGDLRFLGDLLYDTATRADCTRRAVGDVIRCVPSTVAAATTLFTAGCAVPIQAAELPRQACAQPSFATATTEDGFEIHAIGGRIESPLFQLDTGLCLPHSGSLGTDPHALGPAIDPQAFSGAVYFGAR